MSTSATNALVERLNRTCHCISLDRPTLAAALTEELGEGDVATSLHETHPHLFAPSPVFVTTDDVVAMAEVVEAVHRVTDLPAYRQDVLDRAPAIASFHPGALGVFYGYDFHLSPDGPQLIEINTNAGGALLNLHLARAQRACCPEVATFTTGRMGLESFETELSQMFERELKLATPERSLRNVAIVDSTPNSQFLYPELLLFERFFQARGVNATIADPSELSLDGNRLVLDDRPLDLVYNRLTDFYFESPECSALRSAYLAARVAVTPHPHGYALFADKHNLCTLSDAQALVTMGADEDTVRVLTAGIPATWPVTNITEDELWQLRKTHFFKPTTGYGSRGAYDGSRMTRKVARQILESGDYVAQKKVPPSQRFLLNDGQEHPLKVDVRAFVYDRRIQLVSARLYRGQTTNLRTEGGGLATVFVAPPLPPARDPAVLP